MTAMPFDAAGRTPRKTNAQMLFAVTSMLCEHEPGQNRPAMLSDPYHGIATVQLGGGDAWGLRVCEDCAQRFFSHRSQRPLRRTHAPA